MDLTQVTILVLLGFFRIISGNVSSCKFGENCVYPCHCQDEAVCDANDGSCLDGCDDGDLRATGDYWYRGAWSGYGCQLGNVAFMKSATQHGNYNDYSPLSAVDGGHDPIMSEGSCAHPGSYRSVIAWWQVDLGTVYVVLSINITNRDAINNPENERRTAHLNIFVSETRDEDTMENLCYAVGAEGSMLSTYVNCPRPMKAQHVKLIRQTGDSVYQSNWMNFCEVQVYGYLYYDCPDNYFGVACGTACNCQDPCDNLNGVCSSGNCLGGWNGNDCQTPCVDGKWGANCPNDCHCMDEDEPCDRVNGQCSSGCDMTYGGLSCNLVIPTLENVISLDTASQTSLTVRFEASIPDDIKADTPVVFDIQQKLNGTMTWVPSHELPHSGSAEYITMLEDLEPNTPYYVNIVPVIKENGMRYPGFAKEAGPFWTLEYAESDPVGTSPITTIVGVVLALIFLFILAIVVVFFLRRHLKRKKDDSRTPVVFGAEKPSLNGDIEHGNENPLYANSNVEAGKKAANGNVRAESPSGGGAKNENNISKPVVSPKPKLGEKVEETTKAAVKESNSVPSSPDEHIYGNQSLLGRPIQVDELPAYIDDMLKRKDGFRDEYVQIPKGLNCATLEGQRTINRARNRFNNICAYDHSRVVLKYSSEEKRSDYINANYIPKYEDEPEGYIAAQGPKKATVIDMWTMVWQTESNRIVMVTKLYEAGKVKCEQYWPSEGVMEVGKFKISLVDIEKFADYTIRVLSLSCDEGQSRPVYQFHFTGWPDNDIPDEATSLLDFRRKVRSHDNVGKGPIIVHCSAGVGRTGTFMALDYLLDQVKAEGMVDVFTYTALMRTNRMQMIQTLEQYAFVYKAILEALQTGETAVPSNELEARYPELKAAKNGKSTIDEQFALLQCLKPVRKLNANEGALAADNIEKNRDRNIVPTNKHRPYLSNCNDEMNDYINAVFVDGYRERQAYIATQLPLPSTVIDLWRLLYDEMCSCIITLDQPGPEDDNTPIYWPTNKDNPLVLDHVSVTLSKEESLDEGAINMMDFEITPDDKESRSVRMYQFMPWLVKTEKPASLENTLMLIDHAQRWQLRSGLGPLCFLCKYGYERSGLIIAACYMLEKLKVDREVDVFQAVKQVRITRPELVTSLAQYEFLYELAIAYINSCEDYANFK